MRIIGLITHNEKGGAQIALLKLKELLSEIDVELEIVYLFNHRNGFSGKILFVRDAPLIAKYLVSSIKLYFLLRENRNKVHGVIAYLPYSTSIGLLIAFLAGVKNRIASQRNPSGSYSYLGRLLDMIVGSSTVCQLNIANSISVYNSFRSYSHRYRRKLTVINNFYSKEIINYNRENGQKSEWLNNCRIDSKAKVFVAVGRIEDQKNYYLAINAISKLENGSLIIVGEGSRKQKMRELVSDLRVSDRIFFAGHLEGSSLYSIIKKADFFLQCSKYEGQSNALLEALFFGKVIICSDIPSHRDVLTMPNGELCGKLIRSENPKEWCIVLEKFLAERYLHQRLKRRALEQAKMFYPERIKKHYRDIFAQASEAF